MDDIITIKECITRLDAIRHEIVSNSRDHFALSAGIAALYEMEKNAPAVNRWIPCSERLPEDNAEVLVSFCRRYVKIGYIKQGDGLRYWVIPGHSVVPIDYIEAWMPRPDAYEPTESEVEQEDAAM